MIDILIPTNKPLKKLTRQINDIKKTVSNEYTISPTCFNVSSPVNRNYSLIHSTSDIVIMIDDDIWGFFPGWADKLIEPFSGSNVVMVSARLMKTKTAYGVMMDIPVDISKPIVESPHDMLPSACIAFRNDGTRFDENYIGAGFEDTDFCKQLNLKYLQGKFVIHNEVKLIHKNEMKNQLNGQLMRNKYYYMNKWGIREKE
jgi:glycosyltransferase involved in cell wall biosynthesis